MRWQILNADVIEGLSSLPDGSVRCCVTSPPYWGLRDYGVDGQIGLESTPDEYVSRMVDVFRGVRRVLADDGTLWLNIGDSYAGSGKGAWDRGDVQKEVYVPGVTGAKVRSEWPGLKPKDLVGIPWLLAFALRADGWYLRQDIIWSKPNPMPESVRDRCTKAHEYVFLLSKGPRYYYDQEAVKEPSTVPGGAEIKMPDGWSGSGSHGGFHRNGREKGRVEKRRTVRPGIDTNGGGQGSGVMSSPTDVRNRRSVWHIATEPYPEAHFATFPTALVDPCVRAGSAEGDTVLDPFCGSGTTGQVALELGRNFIGIELNPEYVHLARRRVGNVVPLLAREVL